MPADFDEFVDWLQLLGEKASERENRERFGITDDHLEQIFGPLRELQTARGAEASVESEVQRLQKELAAAREAVQRGEKLANEAADRKKKAVEEKVRLQSNGSQDTHRRRISSYSRHDVRQETEGDGISGPPPKTGFRRQAN